MGTAHTSPVASRLIRFGHTPDPDDAFMFYGFASGQVTLPGITIEHVLEDIESLNRRAINADIEVTAISAAVYPRVRDTYWILPAGASVGRHYGPILARRAGPAPQGRRVAIPGQHTTALLLLRLLWGEGEFVETRFDEIPAAVLRGEVDYGVLIHETQITHRSMGLERVMDLGEAWGQETGLPIPLGLDVIRKDLGRETALLIGGAFRQSIEIARSQRAAALEYARGFSRGLAPDLNDRFVGMYVNDDTLEIGEEGERALNLLFEKAHRAGFFPAPATADILR